MSKILFKKSCPRCKNVNQYVSYRYLDGIRYDADCKICKVIDEEGLKDFVERKQYSRECPKCHQLVVYKNRETFRQARSLGKSCKSCAAKITISRKAWNKRKTWMPIIGHWPVTHNFFVAVKKFWENLNEVEKKAFLQKNSRQKRNFWSHLRRKNRAAGRKACREVFARKYSGKNHWMKRPEILRKIRKTCEKYRGDNHWFRRNNVST